MLNKLHTACKHCVFAMWNDHTQTDCILNKISIYRTNDIQILDAFDEEKEFYVVNNAECRFYRTYEWLNKLPNKRMAIHKVKEETHIAYHIIIDITDDINLAQLNKTLESVIIQRPLPETISLIMCKPVSVPTQQLVSLMQDIKIPYWFIRRPQEIKTRNQMVDLAVSFVNTPIYTVVEAGYVFSNNFYGALNEDILHYKNEFLCLLPNDDNNGFTTYTSLHYTLGGNFGSPLVDKLLKNNSELCIPYNQTIN